MTLRVDENSSGQKLEVTVGETIEITLPETRTTGFRWILVRDWAPACELSDDASATAATTPGAPGSHSYRFRALKPGTSRIEVHSRRPWEKSAAPARVFTLQVRVRSS